MLLIHIKKKEDLGTNTFVFLLKFIYRAMNVTYPPFTI